MVRNIVKHSVVDTGLREEEIRPPNLMSRFGQLSREDSLSFFADSAAHTEVACPGCAGDCPTFICEKNGFKYNRCSTCASVYVSPRPSAAMLDDYYANSSATRYKVGQFMPSGARARRHHSVGSFVRWLQRLMSSYAERESLTYADFAPLSTTILKEVSDLGFFTKLTAIDPHQLVAMELSELGAECQTSPALEPLSLSAVSVCEVLEHVFDPVALLLELSRKMAPEGMLFITTRISTGFDLQVLGPSAPYIFVPEHLNLLSEAGIERLMERAGFEVVEFSTPGQLDVQFVNEALKLDPSIEVPEFFRHMLNERDELTHHDFQNFLQKNRLSSHLRLAARKISG
jgi:hypothetical protein